MPPVPPNQQHERLTNACSGATDLHNAEAVLEANREMLTLHELIAHRLFQILVGARRGCTYSV
jgi:xylose isomerase